MGFEPEFLTCFFKTQQFILKQTDDIRDDIFSFPDLTSNSSAVPDEVNRKMIRCDLHYCGNPTKSFNRISRQGILESFFHLAYQRAAKYYLYKSSANELRQCFQHENCTSKGHCDYHFFSFRNLHFICFAML